MTTESLIPDPPPKVSFFLALFLFIYHVVLGIVLAYSLYNVWPPQPWPATTPPPANSGTTDQISGAPNTSGTTNTAAGTQGKASPSTAATGTSTAGGTNVPRQPETPSATATTTATTAERSDPSFQLLWWELRAPLEARLILLVLLAGAAGSYLHVAASLVDYLGNGTLVASWVWWYLLRPFIGMVLALLFYFVFRGGFITVGVQNDAASLLNPFGIAALAALVGMFSKTATDKLQEVFTTLFRPAPGAGDATRRDKLIASGAEFGQVAIEAVSPNTGPVGGGTTVTINGTGFAHGTKVTLGGVDATGIVVENGESLTAVTPPHAAGVVTIEIKTADGRKAALKDGFTYQ